VILNLGLIVAGATIGGTVSLGALLLATGVASADAAGPSLPSEQAAASDPVAQDGEGLEDEQQAEPIHDNGLPWPLSSLDLPPAPFDVPPPPPLDIPPPVQVTVPVGVSLGLPAIPLGLPAPQLPPPPEVPLPPAPSIPLPPPPSIPLPPAPF
jgi:formin 2/Wiskott-Aldrich syndrome protein